MRICLGLYLWLLASASAVTVQRLGNDASFQLRQQGAVSIVVEGEALNNSSAVSASSGRAELRINDVVVAVAAIVPLRTGANNYFALNFSHSIAQLRAGGYRLQISAAVFADNEHKYIAIPVTDLRVTIVLWEEQSGAGVAHELAALEQALREAQRLGDQAVAAVLEARLQQVQQQLNAHADNLELLAANGVELTAAVAANQQRVAELAAQLQHGLTQAQRDRKRGDHLGYAVTGGTAALLLLHSHLRPAPAPSRYADNKIKPQEPAASSVVLTRGLAP